MAFNRLTDKQIESIKRDILKSSEESTAKRIKEDPVFAKSHDELLQAYNKLEIECRKRGIVPYEWNGFRVLKKEEIELIPYVLECFDELEYTHSKMALMRALSVKGDKALANDLLERFKMGKHSDIRWAIGEALYNIRDKNYVNDYIDIIRDEQYGENIHPLMQLLGSLKAENAIPVLLELADNPFHRVNALNTLARYKSTHLLNFFNGYLNNEDKSIKRIAKKAIKDIEKFSEKKSK